MACAPSLLGLPGASGGRLVRPKASGRPPCQAPERPLAPDQLWPRLPPSGLPSQAQKRSPGTAFGPEGLEKALLLPLLALRRDSKLDQPPQNASRASRKAQETFDPCSGTFHLNGPFERLLGLPGASGGTLTMRKNPRPGRLRSRLEPSGPERPWPPRPSPLRRPLPRLSVPHGTRGRSLGPA